MTDIFSKKLRAFLHDPVDKAFVLFQKSHEERARELASKLDISVEKNKAFDHIASAMERAFLPKKASRKKKATGEIPKGRLY
jgi:hypothetical protein